MRGKNGSLTGAARAASKDWVRSSRREPDEEGTPRAGAKPRRGWVPNEAGSGREDVSRGGRPTREFPARDRVLYWFVNNKIGAAMAQRGSQHDTPASLSDTGKYHTLSYSDAPTETLPSNSHQRGQELPSNLLPIEKR